MHHQYRSNLPFPWIRQDNSRRSIWFFLKEISTYNIGATVFAAEGCDLA